MAGSSVFGKFLGNSLSGTISYAAGVATGPVLGPVVQALRNEINSKYAYVYPDPGTLAEGVAQGQVDPKDAREWASFHGIGDDAFTALVNIANVGPGAGYAFDLWRRDVIQEPAFRRALKRLGVEKEWIDDLVQIKTQLLTVAEVANAVQQGHVPNDGVLPEIDPSTNLPPGYTEPVAPDGHPPSQVPLTQIDLPPLPEASGRGVDKPRLQVIANLSGLPPPQSELLHMLNRGVIDDETFNAGVREGHTKTKWIAAVKRMRWAVLSGQEYAEAALRAWVTQDEMYAGGALTGHTKEQMDLFYKNRGRTATPRQIWLGIARKVTAPDYPDEPANGRLTSEHDHELAIRRSNIRPEYAPLLYEIRYNYPPIFQLNRLVQAGAIPPETAASWAEKNLTAPEVVDALTAYWRVIYPGPITGGATAPKPKRLTNATIRSLVKKGRLSPEQALLDLEANGLSAADAQLYLEA
jgi:hypothetical protein